jgi:hypothetical protein
MWRRIPKKYTSPEEEPTSTKTIWSNAAIGLDRHVLRRERVAHMLLFRCWYKFTYGKTVELKNVQFSWRLASMTRWFLSWYSSLIKLWYYIIIMQNVLEKGYGCRGIFRLLSSDFCAKVINHVFDTNGSNIWPSWHHHIKFGCVTWPLYFWHSPLSKDISVKFMCKKSKSLWMNYALTKCANRYF